MIFCQYDPDSPPVVEKTGGAGGIGRAIAERYLAEGATVAVVSASSPEDAVDAKLRDTLRAHAEPAVGWHAVQEGAEIALVHRRIDAVLALDVTLDDLVQLVRTQEIADRNAGDCGVTVHRNHGITMTAQHHGIDING